MKTCLEELGGVDIHIFVLDFNKPTIYRQTADENMDFYLLQMPVMIVNKNYDIPKKKDKI